MAVIATEEEAGTSWAESV